MRRPIPTRIDHPARYQGVLAALLAELRTIRALLQEVVAHRSSV
jgi:hypothetical protein